LLALLSAQLTETLRLALRCGAWVKPVTFFAPQREKDARLYLHTMTNKSQQRR
jgi:hypothetical protein